MKNISLFFTPPSLHLLTGGNVGGCHIAVADNKNEGGGFPPSPCPVALQCVTSPEQTAS